LIKKHKGVGFRYINAADEEKSERRDSEKRNKSRVEVAIVKIFMFNVFLI